MSFVSYAQNREDAVLWRVLAEYGPGFFIDVGAGDPVEDSVTKAFSLAGWRGINVEPMAEPMALLRADRPRDINLQLALEAEPGLRSYFSVKGGNPLSTGVEEYAERYREEGWPVDEIEVETDTLANVCARFVTDEIHFLKIDAEGSEAAILAGADFDRFRPWILVVEAVVPSMLTTPDDISSHRSNEPPAPTQHLWEPLLTSAGYQFVLFDGLNRFYVSNEKAHLFAERLSVPCNVLDDVRGFHDVRVLDDARRSRASADEARALADADRMRLLYSTVQLSARSKLRVEGQQEALDGLRAKLVETSAKADDFGRAVVSLRNEVAAIERSFTHRLMAPVRRVAGLARRVKQGRASGSAGVASRRIRVDAYASWRARYGKLSVADRQLVDSHLAIASLPALVMLVRVDVDDVVQIERALSALASQLMLDWHAWISIAPANRSGPVANAIGRHVRQDERLHLVDSDSIDQVPVGEAVVVLTSTSTILSEHALYLFSEAASRGKLLAYGDAEMVDTNDETLLPLFRPELSPLHQSLHNYIGNTVVIDNRGSSLNSTLFEFVAGTTDTASVICTAITAFPPEAVERIPFVLQCDMWNVPSVTPPALVGVTESAARVSVIIPTRDRLDLLEPCVESLINETTYPRELIEIIVVDNGSVEDQTLEYLQKRSRLGDIIVIRDDDDFNYSRLNNLAAASATGDVLVLLNNDTTVFDPEWLGVLVACCTNPAIGAVGGKLLYPDLSVQHGGVVLGIQGVAAHVNHKLTKDHATYNELADHTHEVAAVTGACLAIRADVYREVGGLDEALAITFNDIDLCCACLAHGYRNLYIGSPLIIHHESKSRGYDIQPEQRATLRLEALRARTKYPQLYRDDPYYNPNFSLDSTYQLAEPPRAVRPWVRARRLTEARRCILMLSSTHQVGHGVAVVVEKQARHLAELGHRVIIGGPRSDNDFAYEGCDRVVLSDAVDAAKYAFECRADVVMMHTPPFFATARWLGPEQTKIAYDYGEPDPDLFPDAEDRRGVLADKQFSMALADARYAISEAVRAESGFDDMGVITLGNSHLATWGKEHAVARDRVRTRNGWTDKLVVFNVCRFHSAERNYKGVEAYSALLQVMRTFEPSLSDKIVFVLCGKADKQDILEMEASGLEVFANVTDAELIELYAAADVYINLSKWEGYNLGIGQALAMGLPTLASDIPAHRAFEITTSDDVVEQISFLNEHVALLASSTPPERQPRIWSWDAPLAQLAALIAAS